MTFEDEYNNSQERFRDDPYVQMELRERILRITIKGLEDTPYTGGNFIFEIKLKTQEVIEEEEVFLIMDEKICA